MTANYNFKYSNDLDIGWISDGFHLSRYPKDGVYHADVITIPVEEISDFVCNGDISLSFANKLLSIVDYSRKQLKEFYEEEEIRLKEEGKTAAINNYHSKCNSFELYDYICAYCGCDLTETGHIDRIVPGKKGGKYEITNTVLACPSCNSKKGGRTPEDAGMTIKYGDSNLRKGYYHGE